MMMLFQMTPESLPAAERMIEKFGFPIFVALCALVLFAAVWKYFSKELSMTRTEFLGYLQKRDDQTDQMFARLNDAYNRNTIAFERLRNSVERRIGIEERHTEVLEVVSDALHRTSE